MQVIDIVDREVPNRIQLFYITILTRGVLVTHGAGHFQCRVIPTPNDMGRVDFASVDPTRHQHAR